MENMEIKYSENNYARPSEGLLALKIAFEKYPRMREALLKYDKFHTPRGVWNLESIRLDERGDSSPSHFESYNFQWGDIEFSLETNCLSPGVLGKDKFIITIRGDNIDTIITPWCFHSSYRA